jgi:hypothetical protein
MNPNVTWDHSFLYLFEYKKIMEIKKINGDIKFVNNWYFFTILTFKKNNKLILSLEYLLQIVEKYAI